MDVNEKLIFLLREAVSGGEGQETEPIDEAELIGLFKIAKKHDVANIVSAELESQGLLPENKEVSARFKKEQMTALFRCENLDYETERISRALSDAEIEHIPLKGAVIRELYPERWMRTSCDIDVLVKAERLEEAADALCEKLGYTRENGKNYHELSLYSSSGFHLELHHSIMEKMPCADKVLARAWDYAAPCGDSRFAFRAEYLMFHIIAHAAYHFLGGGCGVRTVLDIHFLQKSLKYDKAVLNELLRESRLDKFAETLLSLSEFWFGSGEGSDTAREMGEYIVSGGAYGNFEQHIANLRTKNEKNGYVLSRIFLPYESLKILYPRLEGRRAMTPVYQAKRWFKLFDKSKRNKIAREMRANSCLDTDEIEKTRIFLERLGLDKNME